MTFLDTRIDGRDVILADAVIDTGLTMHYLVRSLTLRNPGSLRIATLFDRHPSLPYLICAALSFLTGVLAWQFLHKPHQAVVTAKTQSTR